jgi:hypothetical protein
VAVTVAEMARLVGLSRSRFYQLIGSAFPQPVYDVATRRPIYTEELQQVCLDVRRRNCGIDGRPVLFYARRLPTAPARPRKVKTTPTASPPHADLLDGLRSLGLATAAADVVAAVKELFPRGTDGQDQGEVLRVVFLHLKRQNTADKVGR